MMKFFRRFNDLGINGSMARWYDRNSKNHRMEEMKGYAREVAGHIKEGDTVLEIAPGPGYLSIALAKLGNYKITGLDISRDFVEIACKNAGEAGVKVDFQQGNAAELPLPGNTYQFIICTAAFKNFKEPLKVLNEMYRVLTPGGTALVIDMKANVKNQDIDAMIKSGNLKRMDALFEKLAFKYFLKKGAYTKEGLTDLISRTAFKDYKILESGIGFSVYLTK